MADQKIQLTVQVNAETGQLEVLGAKFAQVGEKAKGTGDAFSSLSGEAGGLLRSLLPFATAGGVIAFFTNAVKGAEEQNESFRRLKFTIDGMGISWDKNKQSIEQWTQSIAASTRFSDSDAIAALDKLTRVTGSLSQAQTASQLAMGLSVASGKELSSTIALVTDLLNGNQRALIEVKREFGNVAGGAKDTQQALSALQKAYGDTAAKSSGLTDTTAHLVNSFSELKDSIGNAIIPVLIPAIDLLKKMVDGFQLLGIAIGGIVKANIQALKLDFAGMKETFNQTISDIQDFEAKNTASLATGESERLTITRAAKEKAKQQADQDRAEEIAKVQSFEAEINRNVAELNRDSYQKKLALLNAEVTARRQKINIEIKDEVQKKILLDKLDREELARKQAYAKLEVEVKQAAALQIADTAVQMFAVLNSMTDKDSQTQVTRAKLILALEKSIAIARAIAEAQKGGPLAAGIAAAQIGLITAQFAQQSQAIDAARGSFSVSSSQIAAQPVSIPGGGTVIDIGGGGGVGVGLPTSGGRNVAATAAGGFVVNIASGAIVINGPVGLEDIAAKLGEKIIEQIKGQGQLSFTGGS